MVGSIHHDPLLSGDEQADGRRSRGPIGNSARTLLLFGVLAVIGIAIWWLRRPSDLTDELGARDWVIVEVDDQPVLTPGGPVSAFVLDGTGEARVMQGCGTAVGTWEFDVQSGELRIETGSTAPVDCVDQPETFAPPSGGVDLDGARMTLTGDASVVTAIALGDLAPAGADDIAGRWDAGDSTVEFGERGLLQVGECEGSWTASGAGLVADLGAEPVCDLDPIWVSGDVLVPVVVDSGLFLRRDRTVFPIDRDVQWFASLPDRDSPLLDEP